MLGIYFNIDDYRTQAKNIICICANASCRLRYSYAIRLNSSQKGASLLLTAVMWDIYI